VKDLKTTASERHQEGNGRVSPAVLLLCLLLPVLSQAQSEDADAAAEIDAMEPGVDTRVMDPAADEAEVAAMDPAVPSAVLAQDVTRSQSGSAVMDRLELGRTAITGNQELPKVLYIVPWKKSDPGDLMGKPVNTLLDEVLAPLDREEFVRSVDFYGELNGVEEE
jgi:hypothetical protein